MNAANRTKGPTANRRRLWYMRCAAILVSLTPLALIEAGLRITSPTVMEAVDVDQEDAVVRGMSHAHGPIISVPIAGYGAQTRHAGVVDLRQHR